MFRAKLLWRICACVALLSAFASAGSKPRLWPVPAEIASTHYTVTINGQTAPVMHAAQNLYFLNFEAQPHKKLTITVTADSETFWSHGVDIQPWRLGIRPTRNGRSLTFSLNGPAKISISRPGDFLGQADMLFLFANAPEIHAPTGPAPGMRYYAPGVHTENIDAATGDRIYLAPGAVVFGALNIWKVEHVKVFGPGVIVYDGPQNPADDDGWMHKRNWHCIVMDNAHDIEINGLTCVTRSRSWQIQMKGTRGVIFQNIKVIGANPGNANADGMDWLDGSGDTVIRDSFFRAADDIFALQSSWEGYGPVAFAVQGSPVGNIMVENSVLSTSISNVVRAGWPEKNLEGGNFTLRNSDVMHAGLGGCGIPFALFEIWADPNGRGQSGGYHFQDIRLEDWYSLLQVMQPTSGVTGVTFQDIAALALPSLVPSMVSGQVHDTQLDNVELAGTVAAGPSDVPLRLEGAAEPPVFRQTAPAYRVDAPAGLLTQHSKVRLRAQLAAGTGSGAERFEWSFGDGTRATGREVTHRFADAGGTLLDGSGRYRVLLHVTSAIGRQSWATSQIVVAGSLLPARLPDPGRTPGLAYQLFTMASPTLTGTEAAAAPAATGIAAQPSPGAAHAPAQNYALTFDGYLEAPLDGGYTLTLISNDSGQLMVDGQLIATTPEPFPQVCGLAGNAARPATGSIALAKGLHHIQITETHTTGNDDFRLWWQTPGDSTVREVPPAALSH